MPNFQLSLDNDTRPDESASGLEVIYQLTNGVTQRWHVGAIHPIPVRRTATIVVQALVDLANYPNVRSRTLRVHYPTAPNALDYPIRTVIRA